MLRPTGLCCALWTERGFNGTGGHGGGVMPKNPFENPMYTPLPHENVSAKKVLIFSVIIFFIAWLVIDHGSADDFGIIYMLCFLSGLGIASSISLLAWRCIRKACQKAYKKIQVSQRGQRIGLVACACSIILGIPSASISSQYSWYHWYMPENMYQALFFLCVIAFSVGLLLLAGVPQKILAWIKAGK